MTVTAGPPAPNSTRSGPTPAALATVLAVSTLAALALSVVVHRLLHPSPAALMVALGLVGGLSVAGDRRQGPLVPAAAVLAVALSMAWLRVDATGALIVTAAVTVAIAGTCFALRRTAFDWRIERTRDLLALIAAAIGFGLIVAWAPPLLAGLEAGAPWLRAVAAPLDKTLPFDALLACFAFLLTALPACTLVVPEHRPEPWRIGLAALLSLVVMAAATLPWLDAGAAAASTALFLPFVALLALTAVAGTSVASTTLLLAATAVALSLRSVPAPDDQQALAMLVSLQVLVLVAHAMRAESAWRESRWQWALDGTRLGVADWRLPRLPTPAASAWSAADRAGGPDTTADARRPLSQETRADHFAPWEQLRGFDARRTVPTAAAAEGFRSFVSDAWRAMTGFDRGRWSPSIWVESVHPDDRQELLDALARVASGDAGRLQLELRMDAGAGWRWLETTLLVIERDDQGRPARLLATLLDVDDRHAAQERQRLSASLFQHLHEGLLVTDAELRVLDANPAYSEILGVSRTELLGRVPSLLRPTPADPIARQQRAAMWATLRVSGGWRGELIERRRSGELCTLQVTISSVHGPQGDLRYRVLVITDVSEQRTQRERLERQAHFDELTRLPNRSRLSQLLAEAMTAADRDGHLLAVCYLDLDHFKPVNDRFGHAAGDRLLVELAARLRAALRTRETWADSAARLGGDEFVLLLRADTIEEARLAVERVLRVVAQPYEVDAGADPVLITASMGATVYPIDRSDADTLLRHADHAMYGAKQSGRNGYLFFDPEHRRRTEERVMAIGRVHEALDRAEFVLHYQPKVDMRSARVIGFEALLRWDHPQHGLIAPMQFLPLIENTGLSSRVGDWVFAQALEHLSQWRRNGLDISVSVNVSARHLQEPDFAHRLSELLARHPEPLAASFELEMLETAAHADIEATSALLARCRTLGVRFALDDFGTGYSTLTYLKRLPVDVLKIDRSFVHHMLDDSQDRAIVEGVIGLAGTFGCVVVAEGVESPAQARTLLEMGCDIGQGTGIAAPMPAGQVATWTRQYRGMFSLAPAPSTEAAPGATGR